MKFCITSWPVHMKTRRLCVCEREGERAPGIRGNKSQSDFNAMQMCNSDVCTEANSECKTLVQVDEFHVGGCFIDYVSKAD